ncbi:MAG: ribonuclease R [Bacteroidales bacterium]|nr:ribonuclease R [Bacteroidales bacterium]
MARNNKQKKHGKAKKVIRNQILGIFSNNTLQTFNYKQISRRLDVSDPSERKLISTVLNELVHDGHLEEIERGKYKLKTRGGYICGIVQMTRSGTAFIITDDIKEDVFITNRNLNHALDGDKVKVYLYARKSGDRLVGEITQILEQRERTFVGEIVRAASYYFLDADNKGMPYDIFIQPGKLKGAKDGEKVIARITDWPANTKNPFGEVLEVLGEVGSHETEMHAILAEFELPYSFNAAVEDEADKIPGGIKPEEISRRKDFRTVKTFTIDPADAKDFDDALSIRPLTEGVWEVGIHIADVSHYVRPGSKLDEEAYARGTSVYMVDRVVPMLPERLSNELCSLKPNEDKLCFSAVFQVNEKAEVLHQWFGKTIIHSDRRFSYQEAQDVIETGKGDLKDEIMTLHKLAGILRQRRFSKGAFSFERAEVKFNLDDKGKPLGVFFREAKESNWLIEEFMLLANKKVAEKIGRVKKGAIAKAFVYRIHDRPDPEKIENFSNFVHRFGYSLKTGSDQAIAQSMNQLVHAIKGKNEQYILESLAIRTMAKAKYSCKNIGHYGLVFQYYTHFTSPIRRYPDLMVHRLLQAYLDGGKSENANKCEMWCEHASAREELAVQAERASVKYKQVEFLRDHIGEVFDGVISGVNEWGFYVELVENHCEGMVPVRELTDDFYEYDERNYCLTGSRTHRKFEIGQSVRVEITRTDIARRQIDFALEEVEVP